MYSMGEISLDARWKLVMSSLVGRDRGNSCWDQEEKVWGKRRPVVQQGRGIPALRELS